MVTFQFVWERWQQLCLLPDVEFSNKTKILPKKVPSATTLFIVVENIPK